MCASVCVCVPCFECVRFFLVFVCIFARVFLSHSFTCVYVSSPFLVASPAADLASSNAQAGRIAGGVLGTLLGVAIIVFIAVMMINRRQALAQGNWTANPVAAAPVPTPHNAHSVVRLENRA